VIKDLKPVLIEQRYECFNGAADLFVYFYEKSVNLLRPGGVLAFISSNKYYRAGYGEKLRALLARELTLNQLIDFADAPVFEAIAYASILIGSKRAPGEDATVVAHTWQRDFPLTRFAEVLYTHGVRIPQRELAPDGWRLEAPTVFRLLAKLRSQSKTLDEYVDGQFYFGIKTGLNDAFIVDRATRDRLIAEHKPCATILKPIVRGRDVKRWRVQFSDRYLIKIESSENKQHPWSSLPAREAERQFAKTYPSVYAHLNSLRDALIRRDDQGRFFWELRSCAYWAQFGGQKVLYPDIYEHQSFTWDTTGFYCANTCYFIPTKEKWLAGLLNSRAVEWFYSMVSNKVRGGYMRAFTDYMRQIPVPAASAVERAGLDKLVNRISNTKGGASSTEEAAVEREIDDRIYRLFALTPDEIKIIEDSVPRADKSSATPAGPPTVHPTPFV
jgi:hypothetical protein